VSSDDVALPWEPGTTPLMLAPMRGLTNRALRTLFVEQVRPDVVFTEFVTAGTGTKRRLRPVERADIESQPGGVPLVVQLIGHRPEAVAVLAEQVEAAGARHVNLNVGCPYGRRAATRGGGALLREPAALPALLHGLRRAVTGTLSVKLRAGYEDPRQIFDLLPLLADAGVDFLALHPRTVVQKFTGQADHAITAEVVARTALPVIANGDVRTAAEGRAVLDRTGAAGLMLGRGAIADPWLFARLRGAASETPTPPERAAELRTYLQDLEGRYRELFQGEDQILCKLKEALAFVEDPELLRPVKKLRRTHSLNKFGRLLEALDG